MERHPVQPNGAGAAIALIAALLDPEPSVVAQERPQALAGRGLGGKSLAVDREVHGRELRPDLLGIVIGEVALIGRRAVHVVEPIFSLDGAFDRAAQRAGGGQAIEGELHRLRRRRGDGQREIVAGLAACPDDERGGAPEMGERVAAKGKALLECAGGKMNAAQQLARFEHVHMVAGDEVERRDLARLAPLRPQRVDAFERSSERDHGAGRQRHADIPADGRRVVDLERHQQRVAAQFQQRRRGPVGGRLELLELGDRAGRGDFKSVGGQLERRPAQRLEIDQSVRGDLWRREQPSAAGKIGITRLPPGNFVGGGGALDRGNGVEVHDRRPMLGA